MLVFLRIAGMGARQQLHWPSVISGNAWCSAIDKDWCGKPNCAFRWQNTIHRTRQLAAGAIDPYEHGRLSVVVYSSLQAALFKQRQVQWQPLIIRRAATFTNNLQSGYSGCFLDEARNGHPKLCTIASLSSYSFGTHSAITNVHRRCPQLVSGLGTVTHFRSCRWLVA